MGGGVSPAPVRLPAEAGHTGRALSKPAGGDVFFDLVFKYSLGFELGHFGEDARMRSRGEGDLADNNDAAVEDGVQAESFGCLFLGHGGVVFGSQVA